MNLVTVTCKRDLNQLLLQIHSIEKFVKVPYKHYVILEDEVDIDPNLNVIIIRPELETNLNGWYRQQILKLTAVNYVDEDYILLDSKNFFIKDTVLDFKFPDGSCYLLDNPDWTKPFVDKIKVQYEPLTHYFTQHTPFKIRQKTAKKILDSINLIELYSDCAIERIFPSEFSLYSLFSDYRPNYATWQFEPIYHTWWYNDELVPDEFETIYNSSIEILGLHKNVWYHTNDKLKLFADWVCSKGLSKQFVYPATVNMNWGKTYLQDRPITNPHAF